MTTKPNSLREAMQGIAKADAAPPESHAQHSEPKPTVSVAPSRRGKRSVGGHFTPEAARQLRILAAETDNTVQDLLAEALNDLFRKHNRSAIA